MPHKNPPGPDLSVAGVDAATRARSTETVKTVNPSHPPIPGPAAQQSQTHSGGSRDRPVTGPYYYDRKQ